MIMAGAMTAMAEPTTKLSGPYSGHKTTWKTVMAMTVITMTSVAVPLHWVGQKVSAQIALQERHLRNIRAAWEVDAHQTEQLCQQLTQLLAKGRAEKAQHDATAKALTQTTDQIIATEKAINYTVTQMDHLTGTPVTNLLPLSPALSSSALTPMTLPAMPTTPPVIHTITGASGKP
ncbi:hypothetical protein [Sulfobacillus thermosulfidooxidans]|uniref:hypothetical protein n=1 Tax=Sulfobacillus thermosulfidooxidans TaxID=28034 RepID=UPI0002D9015E|nr:hypothetical protein [Sulfobacillus thermosulfidooxidans]